MANCEICNVELLSNGGPKKYCPSCSNERRKQIMKESYQRRAKRKKEQEKAKA